MKACVSVCMTYSASWEVKDPSKKVGDPLSLPALGHSRRAAMHPIAAWRPCGGRPDHRICQGPDISNCPKKSSGSQAMGVRWWWWGGGSFQAQNQGSKQLPATEIRGILCPLVALAALGSYPAPHTVTGLQCCLPEFNRQRQPVRMPAWIPRKGYSPPTWLPPSCTGRGRG